MYDERNAEANEFLDRAVKFCSLDDFANNAMAAGLKEDIPDILLLLVGFLLLERGFEIMLGDFLVLWFRPRTSLLLVFDAALAFRCSKSNEAACAALSRSFSSDKVKLVVEILLAEKSCSLTNNDFPVGFL